MGVCFLHGNGIPTLGYTVKAYATEELLDADKPYEGTIGVVTDVEIGECTFDSNEPTVISNGEVWFRTAEKSGLVFNALKKDTLLVRPKDCKQYIPGIFPEPGKWVERVVKTYTRGKWIPWVKTLFSANVKETWFAGALPMTNGGAGKSTFSQDYDDGSKKIMQESGKGGAYHLADPVDLTSYNTIVFDGDMTGDSDTEGNHCGLYVWSAYPVNYYTENVVKSLLTKKETVTGERYLDVSDLTGEYYIGFGLYGSTANIYMKNLRLEAATIKEVTA